MDERLLVPILIVALLFVSTSVAETTCDPATPLDCTIMITVNIAFSFNDSEISWNQIQDWVSSAESVWNGPGGNQVYGECNCKVQFQINAVKITDPAQANCNPGPDDYHCVMITDYDKNPPQNEAGNKTYRAYMYGTAGQGESINGWWSDTVDTPHPDSPTGQNAEDAAHEIGHMLGLEDDYDEGPPPVYGNNIMGTTHGNDAVPTQDQINDVVERFCGEDCCPDECCCGNGIIEDDKGEDCDPFADPTGCEGDTYCCKLCCGCHDLGCMPEFDSYATKEDCEEQCKNGDCYFNYDTGCWDCVERNVTTTPSPADSVTPSPGTAGSATPKGTDISSIIGALGILIGAGMLMGGFKTGAKSFMISGVIIALIGLIMMIMQPIPPIPPEPIELPPPKPEGIAIGTIRPMYAVQTWDPEPEPAEYPDEPILMDPFESVEDHLAWEPDGGGSIIPPTDDDSDDDSLRREPVCSDTNDCDTDFTCIGGICVEDPDMCISNINCDLDEVCDGGECKPCSEKRLDGCSCSALSQCEEGYKCVEKICYLEDAVVCGDDRCEGDEDCATCEDDCGCGSEYLCDPSHYDSDDKGCYLEPSCGGCPSGTWCDVDQCKPCSPGSAGEGCPCEDPDDCGDDYGCAEDGQCYLCEPNNGIWGCPCGIGNSCDPLHMCVDDTCDPLDGDECGDGECGGDEACNTCPEDCMDACLSQSKCCHPDFGCTSDCGDVDF